MILLFSLIMCTCSSTASGGSEQPAQKVQTTVGLSFNTDSAMMYIKTQTDFGPRVPDSEAHKKCGDWLVAKLVENGAVVSHDINIIRHPVSNVPLKVRNIFAQFNPEASNRVLILAHYDTRPWADEDSNPSNHNIPIDGANDGASGVAVALEIARHANNLKKDKGLDILFVDQEDSGNSGNDASWCIGSSFWAQNMPYSKLNKPAYAILLDMVGGKDAIFMREYFSELYAPEINDLVWSAAAKAGYESRFSQNIGGAINDDHIPLIKAGLPTIDIIETRAEGFNPTWHTLNDTYENIDPQTIMAVGEVLTNIIY